MAEEIYHGHKLSYSTGGGEEAGRAAADETPSLKIDDQEIAVVVHSDGTYSAKEYYYDKFGSVAGLARAIVRRLPETE